MKTIVKIHGLFLPPAPSTVVSEDLFRELCRIYPAGSNGRRFQVALSIDDPRLRAITAALSKAGLRPWTDVFRESQSDEYSIVLFREYGVDDLAAAHYFKLRPRTHIEGLYRSEDGLLKLDVERLTPAHIASTNQFNYVVSPRLKRLIEESGLRGAVFRRTYLTDFYAFVDGRVTEVRLPWHDHSDPFWELTSDATMPPLAPSNSLFDNDGNRFVGDYSNGCILREGLYQFPELHYTSTSMAAVGESDFALTAERFGIKPDADDRILVASKRFYEVCVAHDLELDWIPVRIDP